MRRFFDILLQRTSKPTESAKPSRSTKPTPSGSTPPAGSPFRAARVVPGLRCCTAAKLAHNHPVLARDARVLPLPDCTMASECACRYAKLNDRRGGERRALGADARWAWYSGVERRRRTRR